jgi:hypothetical protein
MTEAARTPNTELERHCPWCGALVPSKAATCWLCHEPLSSPAGSGEGWVSRSAIAPLQPSSGFSLASLMMFVTLLCVVLGVSTIAPGLGIPFGIVMLVAWLRTAAVARRRAAHGFAVTRLERLQLFISSVSTTIVLLVLICVAGCAALVAACFACVFTWGGLGSTGPAALPIGWIAAAIVAGAIAITAILGIVKLIDRRWRRDAGEE